MKINVSKRDLSFFLLGVLSLLVVEIALDWERASEAFQKGWRAGYGEQVAR